MSAEPDSDSEPEAWVRRIMTDFYPNLICPAEMWWQVLEALGPSEHLTETPESISLELKAMVRDFDVSPSFHLNPAINASRR